MTYSMPVKVVSFLALLLLPVMAWAQGEARAAFAEGNALFEAGDFDAALAAYERAGATGFTSAALLHNIGSAHYQRGQLGRAIQYFERARRLAPDDEQIRASLHGAQLQARDPIPVQLRPFYQSRFEAVLLAIGADTFFLAGLLLYLVAIGLAGYAVWHGRWGTGLRRGLLVLAPMALLLIALAFLADAPPERVAVVLVPEVALREAPALSAPTTTTLHEGAMLDVLTLRGDWLQARLPTGTTGWLPTTSTGDV